MAYLGIDIGGTSVKLAALDRGGQALWTAGSTSYGRPSTDELLSAIREAAAGRQIAAEGVGICVPGILDPATRTIVKAVNVPGLVGIPLDELVGRALGQEVKRLAILTDAHATAYDIYASRRLAGRLLVLALGTGVGGAVLDEGRPLEVDGNTPGHFGQMDVSIEGEPVIGPDGGAGSLEGYIGVPALRQRYGDDLLGAIEAWRGEEPPLRALARAIRIGHAMFRPHHIALTGGIGIRLKRLVPQIRALVEKDLTHIARPGWTLDTGESDYHAALGAARLAAVSGKE